MDDLLEVVENPLRRKILLRLSKEGHYPLQLSKELKVSQQAIMKHLKILEEFGLVSCSEEKSDRGGPPRKLYSSKKQFSIRIDVGPSIFRNELYTLDEDDKEGNGEFFPQLAKRYDEILNTDDGEKKLAKTCTLMREIDKEIEKIEKQRNSLVRFKEHISEEANNAIRGMCDSYQERQLLYLLMDSNEEVAPGMIPDVRMINFDDLDDVFEKIVRKMLIQK